MAFYEDYFVITISVVIKRQTYLWWGGGTVEFGVKVSVEETDPSQDNYISVQLVASIGAPPHKLLSIIFN